VAATAAETTMVTKTTPAETPMAAAPGHDPTLTCVTLSMTVHNLNYFRLSANHALLHSFRVAVRAAIASEAGHGIAPEHVGLVLSPGSVLVDAMVTPPRAALVGPVHARLQSAALLAEHVAAKVASLYGVETVATGRISVGHVSVAGRATGVLDVPRPAPEERDLLLPAERAEREAPRREPLRAPGVQSGHVRASAFLLALCCGVPALAFCLHRAWGDGGHPGSLPAGGMQPMAFTSGVEKLRPPQCSAQFESLPQVRRHHSADMSPVYLGGGMAHQAQYQPLYHPEHAASFQPGRSSSVPSLGERPYPPPPTRAAAARPGGSPPCSYSLAPPRTASSGASRRSLQPASPLRVSRTPSASAMERGGSASPPHSRSPPRSWSPAREDSPNWHNRRAGPLQTVAVAPYTTAVPLLHNAQPVSASGATATTAPATMAVVHHMLAA